MPGRFGKSNSVYRQHLRWSHGGLWPDILKMIVAEEEPDDIIAIDATHLKAHQDACRHSSEPAGQGLGKTKGGRNSKINAVVNSRGNCCG